MPVTNVKTQWNSGELLTSFASGPVTLSVPSKWSANSARLGVITNVTLTAADSGRIIYVAADAKTITLPATVVGYNYTIVNAGADGDILITIAPNSSDAIAGGGLTAVANKALLNTKLTAKRGDMVRIIADGADGWYIQELIGTWAKQG